MKYAFIALIAIYLVTYGCSPDNSEKATDSHESTAPATLETPKESVQPVEVVAVEVVAVEVVAVETAEQAQPVVEQQQVAPVVEQRVVVEKQTVTKEEQPAVVAESEQVVMPCGRTMARADIPKNAPCLKLQPQGMQDTADHEQDLSAAIQRMVETTNDMVLATKQLVIATQAMLNAGKGVAVEVLDTGKEIMEVPEGTQPVEEKQQ